jgi:AraC-like DNA-binding protein
MVQVKARSPNTSELRPFVESIWCYSSDVDRSYELVMPGGRGQFIINLFEKELRHWATPDIPKRRIGPVGLQGALTRPVVIDTNQKRDICGVAFHHGGLSAFHDQPAKDFTDTIVDGVAVFGEAAHGIRDALREVTNTDQRIGLIEAFLLKHLRSRPAEDALIQRVSTKLTQGTTVSEVRARFGLSQRRLHDLFDRRIGIRPKLYARIERFAAALDTMPDRRCWSDLAFAHGFADQAHFIREFQQLSGYLPSQHAMVAGETRHARPSADEIFNTGGGS